MKLRTISAAYEELKKADPDSCVSMFFLRQLVNNGDIPSVKAGKKFLIDMEEVEAYFKGAMR